jgi:hypothetical protein
MRASQIAWAVLACASVAILGPAATQAAATPRPGSVQGILKDPNGLVVTGFGDNTKATLRNNATGESTTVMVTVDGTFSFPKVPAGKYLLTVPISSAMYMGYEQKDVEVAAGKVLKLDLPIKWGMNLGTIGDDPTILGNDLRRLSKYVDGPTPRAADGHPDFTGNWVNIPDRRSGPRLPPMKPWAAALNAMVLAAMTPGADGKPSTQHSGVYCMPQSATPVLLNFPLEFVHTKGRLVELNEFETPAFREIYLDGRAHPDPNLWNPSWYGHSVGQWEGDTLVIDSTGYNEWTPGYGIHTEALHVVQRYARPSVGRLVIDVTASDPRAWTGPHEFHYELGLITGDELQEWVCAENNLTQHFGEEPWLKMIHRVMEAAPQGAREGTWVEPPAKP